MKYTIRHETKCHYDTPASYSIRNLHITPREEAGVRVANWHVSTPTRATQSIDAWGNTTHLLTLTEPHEDVRIVVTGVVDVPEESPALVTNATGHPIPQTYLAQTRLTAADSTVAQFAHIHFGESPLGIPAVQAGLSALRGRLLIVPSAGEALVGAETSFTRQRATLHDHVHVAIAMLRTLGVPARFVSGYLLGRKAGEYAWMDVWLDEEGEWISFDVRLARLATGHQIRLAVGRDYLDACPMRTAHSGGGHEEVRISLQAA